MVQSFYLTNLINDLVADWVERNMERYHRYLVDSEPKRARIGDRPIGRNLKEGKVRDYTPESRAAAEWLVANPWPPVEAFRHRLFSTIWHFQKGAGVHAAHWRDAFLESKAKNASTRAVAQAAARGEFIRTPQNSDYVRLRDLLPEQRDVREAAAEEDILVAGAQDLNAITGKKAAKESERQELCNRLIERSMRVARQMKQLQKHWHESTDSLRNERWAVARRDREIKALKRELRKEQVEKQKEIEHLEDCCNEYVQSMQRVLQMSATQQGLLRLFGRDAIMSKIEHSGDFNFLLDDQELLNIVLGEATDVAAKAAKKRKKPSATPPPQGAVAQQQTVPVPLIVKEEPIDEQFRLADLEKEIQALAKRLSLLFRIENDVFVLMLPTEEGDNWFSRLLMLRDDNSSIRLAEFTGSSEAFAEKAEHWLKSDFEGPQQLMEALNAKCVEYFQQQKMAQDEDNL